MADIISGKSRFNGDRNAPVKKIVNINKETAASYEADDDVLDEAVVRKKENTQTQNKSCNYCSCSGCGASYCSIYRITSNR